MTTVLEVSDLRVAYPGRGFRVRPHEVLHGVSLTVGQGETLGVVGESGSGKTTIGRSVLGLVAPSGGTVRFQGNDVTRAGRKERRALARDIQVVFQDPYSSLNPALTIGDILTEPLIVQGTAAGEARRRVAELLDQVGLPEDASRRLPREFSGGQRQRVAIARALAPAPGSSCATNPCQHSTSPPRPVSSISSSTSSGTPASPTSSSRTTSPSSGTSATA